MIKDVFLRIVFIPLLGVFLPVLSGIIHYRLYSFPELLAANLFFILVSPLIWGGCNWIHGRLRRRNPLFYKSFYQNGRGVAFSAIYGAIIGRIACAATGWMKISKEAFDRKQHLQFYRLLCHWLSLSSPLSMKYFF